MASATIKPSDGKGHLVGFRAYYASHVATFDDTGRRTGGALVDAVRGATERRKAATCELAGISPAEYDARAEAFVTRLLARHVDLIGRESLRDHALAFASHRALADAQARAGAAPASPEPEAPMPAPEACAAEPRPVPRATARRGPRKVRLGQAVADDRRAPILRELRRLLDRADALLFRATYRAPEAVEAREAA